MTDPSERQVKAIAEMSKFMAQLEHDHWHPELTDKAWCKEVRNQGYDDEDHGLDDDEIREKYAGGRRYATTWDHIGDAYDEWEPMCDDWLRLKAAEGEKP